ncbi:Y-family DNA polymerase [Pedobacter sp. MC2016-15]|uniref:Y-family DNA polymerase n=1 Tax=Pedobacter sp. MC2016-15 TaxID=2994473 RepID=UPI002247EEEA|nr:Y-family DNA polymerase [Pedobacter sp. MC2016-15]MCX2480716.1 Y-family DNA polymerase [Pedobacter sp. MC2016-15]
MLALIDSNNFYVSAERVFQPALRGRPGCVLSNNDGCAISRSNEAKEIGIKMGTPYFAMQEQQQLGEIWWRSSNYTLYQDMMRRITGIVRDTFPDQEIYSIDECYCDLSSFAYHDIEKQAILLRSKILQYTGVPVCIGIGATKTLAKIANKIAKKEHASTGVFFMDTQEKIDYSLQETAIEDVWGIGPRYAIKLIKQGFYTALDFVNLPEDYVLKLMTIQGRRTWRELQGERCIPMEYEPPAKEGISTGRSFCKMETELAPIEEALAFYVANTAVKLRNQQCVCSRMFVYLQTSQFAVVHRKYCAEIDLKLLVATAETGKLIKEALAGLRKIYKPGFRYQKVGVELRGLIPDTQVQASLFEAVPDAKELKMQQALKVIDQLNSSYGRDMVRYGTMGFSKSWAMRQEFLSKRYTTRIEDVIKVKAY